jgi:hypothetical protein
MKAYINASVAKTYRDKETGKLRESRNFAYEDLTRLQVVILPEAMPHASAYQGH